ncbi:hypothetical protein [Pseudomonas sp. NPDC089569]|uniref:hypothetical protein n=1 Tax=Pseudomonas sp. NPDC089569 TaxID=3390722 RepID=UPI003CFDE567
MPANVFLGTLSPVGARLAGERILEDAFAGKPGSYRKDVVLEGAFAGKPGSYRKDVVLEGAFAGKPGSYKKDAVLEGAFARRTAGSCEMKTVV